MAFREVTMLEVKEVLRQWSAGDSISRVAARLSADRKTVRRYVRVAQSLGFARQAGAVSEELVSNVIAKVRAPTKPAAELGWQRCVENKESISKLLNQGVRLTKIVKLMRAQRVELSYWTLRRFAQRELAFGRAKATIPVQDGEPGSELQVDTGWVLRLADNVHGSSRRLRAFIFTPHVSRYRFVYPIERETTEEAVDACEAAWRFYGGVFRVLVPDNTKAIVEKADALSPKINQAFLEYSQSRGFLIDPARSRRPKDKARVERAVRDVRDDCFAGDVLHTVAQARQHGERWSKNDYGMRKHSTTQRLPKEHFSTEELAHLLPLPTDNYDTPVWCSPKVGRDQLAQVCKSLYSLPTLLIGRQLTARADSQMVRFYDNATLVKTHARVALGKRSIDVNDYPREQSAYAMRDVNYLAKKALEHGENTGAFAQMLLAGDLPWTKMRRVRKLLSLAKKYGDERIDSTCATALVAQMHDVQRLERMLAQATKSVEATSARIIPVGRYLRPPKQYALTLEQREAGETKGDN